MAQTVVSPAPMKKTPRPVIHENGRDFRTGKYDHPTIVTARRAKAVVIPPALLPETPEEHRRRGELAKQLWRDLVRAANGKDPS